MRVPVKRPSGVKPMPAAWRIAGSRGGRWPIALAISRLALAIGADGVIGHQMRPDDAAVIESDNCLLA